MHHDFGFGCCLFSGIETNLSENEDTDTPPTHNCCFAENPVHSEEAQEGFVS